MQSDLTSPTHNRNQTSSSLDSSGEDYFSLGYQEPLPPLVDGESASAVPAQQPTPVGTPASANIGREAGTESVSISTAFPPGPTSLHDSAPPDVVILSSDQVFFGVHSHRLLTASKNHFGGRLPKDAEARRTISGPDAPYILALPEDSLVLNVVIHTIYGLSCIHYSPSFNVISAAASTLKLYAMPLTLYLAPNAPLYSLILSQAPLPGISLEAFTLAAENGIERLAAMISPYLLPIEPDDIPDALALRMGGVYMKRVCGLRERRHKVMRNLVITPPFPHPPDRRCTPSDRQGVARAWMLAAAQLVWDFTPDMSPHTVRAILGSLSEHASCPSCKESLNTRVNEVVVKWTLQDRTI